MRSSIPCLALAALVLRITVPSSFADKVVLVAGGGDEGDDLPATQVRLHTPFAIDFDRAGNLFIVEMADGERVRRVDAQGILTTIAGTREKGAKGDGGPALKAQFNGMHSLAVAPNGDLFVADTWNNRVRRINTKTRVVSAFAGTGDTGFSGDGGLATEARFGGVFCAAFDAKGDCIDRDDNVVIADTDNHVIRKFLPKERRIVRVAGTGRQGSAGVGLPAEQAEFNQPHGVGVHRDGALYIVDSYNNRIVKIVR